MNCLKVTKLISDSQERQLSFVEKVGTRMHLITCPYCRNFKRNNEQVSKMMKKFAKG
ncbi:MAG: zf-HC2 domain-containing protein [[Pasteurella] aerogenes]|nr:zf-HC2 domain-containing protein [[Pasteurella] aerogenes]MDY4479964.1 zf-HC2 domain-containing protein [[Pasteurella] aerogenes]MDY4594536.1 zf-HC2 domain-containing protein [[Pasteurella] aerogenes]